MKLETSGYQMDIIVTGFPGKSVCHGTLGWSTIVLLKGEGRVILIDVGAFGMRKLLLEALKDRGLTPEDVTDVLLTHSHYDHALNWVMFPNARIVIGGEELDWSLTVPWGRTPVAELYMKELKDWPRLHRAVDGEGLAPRLSAHVSPGHTPGHLIFVLEGEERDIVFTGDAAKNRAELTSRKADMTYDQDVSSRSINDIVARWQRKPGSILVPGHDLPMTIENGEISYVGKREAGIRVFSGDDLDKTTISDLVVT
jgi:glyoxylase-like metal-dependent hydrolase (beta-lactamase superfamily II)